MGGVYNYDYSRVDCIIKTRYEKKLLLTLSQLGVIFFSGVGGGSKMCTLDQACLF